jgi:hypothetical protein
MTPVIVLAQRGTEGVDAEAAETPSETPPP